MHHQMCCVGAQSKMIKNEAMGVKLGGGNYIVVIKLLTVFITVQLSQKHSDSQQH